MAASNPTTKACSKCGDELRIGDFSIHRGKRTDECLTCRKAREAGYRKRTAATRVVIVDGDRTCRICGSTKHVTKFPIRRLMTGGRGTECKECDNARQRAWRKNAVATRPDFIAARKLSQDKIQAKRYGLTLEQYRMLEAMATGKCEICQKPARRRGNWRADSRLHIDHDHKSGRVRGMLCTDCNRGLGLFGDNPKTLQRAAEYICQRS